MRTRPTKFSSVRTLWIAAQFASGPLAASGTVADVGIAQALQDNLPRPIIGIAAQPGPALPFFVSLEYRCPAGMGRQQLFVSIADTARVEEIPVGQPSPVTLRLDVPFAQLQWLEQPEAACAAAEEHRPPDDADDRGIRYFRLHPGTTGAVTLTCRADDGREVVANAATPLDVWLSCPAPADPSALR